MSEYHDQLGLEMLHRIFDAAEYCVIRNVAGNNVHSYTEIAAGNNVAPIDTNFSSTNPFANFQN